MALRKFSFEAQKTGGRIIINYGTMVFHPVILDTLEKIEQRLHYIHHDAVDALIVFLKEIM
jgi:hypothetical protein